MDGDRNFSHAELCSLAVEWLKRSNSRRGPGCQVAISEARNGYLDGEIPDAIGFRAGLHGEASVVVEVKVSRADFLADMNKPHRANPALGMGRYRYFMGPAGLIFPYELPAKWGLIEVTPKGSLKVVRGHVLLGIDAADPWAHEVRNTDRELGVLARLLMRFGDIEGENRLIRDLGRRNAQLVASNDELRGRVKQLSQELYLARHQGDTTVARPRCTS